MHVVNLEPLLTFWPVLTVLFVLLAAAGFWSAWSARRPDRQHARRQARYREQEAEWQSRLSPQDHSRDQRHPGPEN